METDQKYQEKVKEGYEEMRRVQDENKAVSLKMETGQEEASSARQGS